MPNLDYTKTLSLPVELVQKLAVTIQFNVIDKDCDTDIETPRDLTGVVPTFKAYDNGGFEVLSVTGSIDITDTSLVIFSFTEDDLKIYPSDYALQIFLDTDLLFRGTLTLKENANYPISYPTVTP